ncbi:MAG: diguanylate cyclase [Chloroflexota bacterium]|nr:diguanylate cyclase [Chloroflexota bacterium]
MIRLRHANAQLMRTLAGVELLYRFQEKLDIAATRQELVRQLLIRARAIKHARLAGLVLVDDQTFEFKLTKVSPRARSGYVQEEIDRQADADVFGAVVNQRKAMVVPARGDEASGLSIRSLIMVPLIARFELLGVLIVAIDVDEDALTHDVVRLLSIACKQFALAVRNQLLYNNLWKEKVNLQVAHDELAAKVRELESTRDQLQTSLRELKHKTTELEHFKAELEQKVEERTRELVVANQELDRLSSLDGLTGVYNRRHLDEALARENERAQRYGIPTTVLVFDLNGLKAINDVGGHLMGDMAIKEAAQLLQATARRTDVVARFGGDEFVVIASHTGDASGFVKRVHAAIAAWNEKNAQQHFELSLSVGWAVADRDTDLFMAMQKADELMYQDKEAYYKARGSRPREPGPHIHAARAGDHVSIGADD